jgi:AcrR family transcriptional regulator
MHVNKPAKDAATRPPKDAEVPPGQGSGRKKSTGGKALQRRTQAERSESTRGALVRAARGLFAEHGFAGVGTEEIVRTAGVTRGALYHHFEDKRDLFEAVYVQIEVELAEQIAAGALAANAGSPLEAMRAGAEMFLQACTEPEAQRIVLLDGPSVLGWDRWREIASEHGLGLIEASLRAAIDAGAIAEQPVAPLAHVLMGALDEAAMLVARAEDPERMRGEVGRTLDSLLAALSNS